LTLVDLVNLVKRNWPSLTVAQWSIGLVWRSSWFDSVGEVLKLNTG